MVQLLQLEAFPLYHRIQIKLKVNQMVHAGKKQLKIEGSLRPHSSPNQVPSLGLQRNPFRTGSNKSGKQIQDINKYIR